MKRREFVNFVGLGLLAGSLPVAIAACNQTTETASDDVPSADPAPSAAPAGFETVGTVANLDARGFLNKKGLSAGDVIVVRDPASTSIIALSSKCTHQGCSVDWEGDEFSCACHGSVFAIDGTVTVGPAVNPLESFEAMVEGDTVFVKSN